MATKDDTEEKGSMFLTTISVLAGAKLLERILVDLYDGSKGLVRTRLKGWQSKTTIAAAYKKIANIRNVKTIWQIDKPVDLTKFYHPVQVAVAGNPIEVTQVSQFPSEGQIHIEGIVGQGKSIFLRFLCATELQLGQKLPVFAELRRLDAGVSLIQFLINQIEAIGLSADEDVFDYLASSGKLVLFLDAFDEVDDALQAGIITQIEALSHKYEKLRIVITSRPGSGLQSCAAFHIYRLVPLDAHEISAMIRKLVPDTSFSQDLIDALEKNPIQIVNLLTTPLMVTLLVITYKAMQRLPEQPSEFYENLFDLLLARHDKSKPGFVRKRISRFNDREMRDVFDALCYLLRRRSSATAFTNTVAYDETKRAITACTLQGDAEAFLTDIKRITCLLLEEAGKTHFIHKSVAEFHAARFIQSRPPALKEKFYKQIAGPHFDFWSQELAFLSQIDKYHFAKFFQLNQLLKILGNGSSELPENWKSLASQRLLKGVATVQYGVDRVEQSWIIDSFSRDYPERSESYYSSECEDELAHSFMSAHLSSFVTPSQLSALRDLAERMSGIRKVGSVEPPLYLEFTFEQLLCVSEEAKHLAQVQADQVSEGLKKVYDNTLEFLKASDSSAGVFDDFSENV